MHGFNFLLLMVVWPRLVRSYWLNIRMFSNSVIRKRKHSSPSPLHQCDSVNPAQNVFGQSIQNIREIIPGSSLPLYRSAALDNISSFDVSNILKSICTIVDLRNGDEISRGYDLWRFKGAFELYSQYNISIRTEESLKRIKEVTTMIHDNTLNVRLNKTIFQLPIFGRIDSFWGLVKRKMLLSSSMSTFEQYAAEARWLLDTKDLSDRLVSYLADGGLPLLYAIMLENSKIQIRDVLLLCLLTCEKASKDSGSSVDSSLTRTAADGLLLHCAQGKDRTGIVSMLLEFALVGDSARTEESVVLNYSLSQQLLINKSAVSDKVDGSSIQPEEHGVESAAAGVVRMDLMSSMKGSPPQAMIRTIAHLREEYGSIDGYLDHIGFGSDFRFRLRAAAAELQKSRQILSSCAS